VAVITGGARGQGAAEARRFVAEGAQVVITDILDSEGKEIAASLGANAIYCSHDVRHEDSWAEVVAAAQSAFGKLNVLVNNAGILHMAPILETSLEDYMRVVETNQVSCFLGMKAVAPAMQTAGSGSIVNISSIAGMMGIRVNSIHPGGVATPMVGIDDVNDDTLDAMAGFGSIPIQRIGTPEEMANLALFLASDESSYCTGSEFIADGGLLAGPVSIPQSD
jgi:3alpha(or 20beta)-hydroxysteroid dehydrogenase